MFRLKQSAQLQVIGECGADEAIGGTAGHHAVELEVEALEFPDVEGGFLRGEQRFHAEPQRRRLRLVEPEARRKQRGGFEQEAIIVAFRMRFRPLVSGAKEPGLAGRLFDPVAGLQYS